MPRKASQTLDDTQPGLFDQAAPAPKVTRRFLGWDKPLVRAAAELLARDWSGGALDLSDWLIIVPTRNASRRLREALAMLAATRDAAVLPPMTVTPDFLSSPQRLADSNAAGGVQTLLLWAAELLRLEMDGFRHLFPIDPVERSFTWALKTAGDLLQVRETLNESGLGFADAARLLANSEMEPERWSDLARLEQRCIRATEEAGFEDWQVARRRAAVSGTLPDTVHRIMIVGVLDPSQLAILALERHARRLPVEVVIFAPQASHHECFDFWGRPVAQTWLRLPIHVPSPDTTIHQGSTPSEQARAAVDLLAVHEKPGEVAAIGIADAEVAAPLEKTLAEQDIGAYDPAGKRMGTHGVFHLLRIVSRLCATRSFTVAAELMRCPDVADAIRSLAELQNGERPSLNRLLNELDEVAVQSLPDTLDDAIELAPRVLKDATTSPLIVGLEWMDRALDSLSGDDFGAALTGFLSEVFAARTFRSDRPQDAVFAVIADQMSEVLDALDGPAVTGFEKKLSAAQRLEVLLRMLEDQVFYPERTERDIDLQGWLELLWEDAPHVVVAGMNDGKVPESIVAHAFLPDSARRALGLRDNDTRFARDACVMTSIIELRQRMGGRTDFIFGRIGAADEPLRPSRLLFQCPDKELPARTLQFFKHPALRSDPMPFQLAWRLKPQPLPDDASIFRKLSVTAFRDYLTCPFRFYLKHGLKMESVDVSSTEMDALQFGNLMHHVLEKFSQDTEASMSADANVIRACFERLLDSYLHAVFGPRLTVPVAIQRESARQRLSWWAEHEAQEREKGWSIVVAETRISPEGDPWMIADMVISGVVDRVERHEKQGIRLIDFKTYSPSSAKNGDRRSVEDYHLAKIKRTEDESSFPAWVLTRNRDGELARWIDLQLPLYRLAMERRHPGEKIQTAYATLGKTKADISVDEWPELEGAQLDSARACAEGVINAVRSKTFWPPAEKLPYTDPFGSLFFGDVLAAVDPSELLR